MTELELNLSKLSPKDVSSQDRDASGNNDSMTLGEAFGKSFPPPPTKSEMLASTNSTPTPPLINSVGSGTLPSSTSSQQQPARFLQHQPSPLQLPGMMSTNSIPPVVTVTATRSAIQEQPPTKVMDMSSQQEQESNLPRKAVCALIEPEPERAVEIPDEKLRDQIQFETNNLTKANIHEKAKQIKELCPETYVISYSYHSQSTNPPINSLLVNSKTQVLSVVCEISHRKTCRHASFVSSGLCGVSDQDEFERSHRSRYRMCSESNSTPHLLDEFECGQCET